MLTHEKTRLPFELDPQIIHHIIHSQAGSIGKAIIELIMNSVDSGSKHVSMTISKEGFSVKDDGTGFASEEDVIRYFGRFGTPHEEGDATFGRFRLGRGQIMAHASTVWKSHMWRMDVDTVEMGYGYDLSLLPESVKGCDISGRWYEPLDGTELLSVYQEIRDLVRYTPLVVEMNGKIISKDPSAEKWDHEDENCYLRLRSDGAMHIYNQGVLVRHDAGHIWGVGGMLVTKKAIGLNVSRTEILRKTCPVWKAIAVEVKRNAEAFLESTDERRKTEARREKYAKHLLAGGNDLWRVFVKEEVVTLLPGNKHITMQEFLSRHGAVSDIAQSDTDDIRGGREYRGKLVSVVEHGHLIGKAEALCHTIRTVSFLHPKTLERFDCSSEADFKEALVRIRDNMSDVEPQQEYSWYAKNGVLLPKFIPFSKVAARFKNNYRILKPSETFKDPEMRSAWTALAWCLKQYGAVALGGRLYRSGRAHFESHSYDILIGDSNSADAWTDGRTYIAFSRSVVEGLMGRGMNNGLNAVSRIFAIMDHELSHSGDSINAGHDSVFHERYHDISINMAPFKQFYTQLWLKKYQSSMENRGKGRRRYDRQTQLVTRANERLSKKGSPGLTEAVDSSEELSMPLVATTDDSRIGEINLQLIMAGVQENIDVNATIRDILEEPVKRAEKVARELPGNKERIAKELGLVAAAQFERIHESGSVRGDLKAEDGEDFLSTANLPATGLKEWFDSILFAGVCGILDICEWAVSREEVLEAFAGEHPENWKGIREAHPGWDDPHAGDEEDYYDDRFMDDEYERASMTIANRMFPVLELKGINLGTLYSNLDEIAQFFTVDEVRDMQDADIVSAYNGFVESYNKRNPSTPLDPVSDPKDKSRKLSPEEQEFKDINGRVPGEQDDVTEWKWARKPKLQEGETVASLIRNANAAGFSGFFDMPDYIEWRGEWDAYFPGRTIEEIKAQGYSW